MRISATEFQRRRPAGVLVSSPITYLLMARDSAYALTWAGWPLAGTFRENGEQISKIPPNINFFYCIPGVHFIWVGGQLPQLEMGWNWREKLSRLLSYDGSNLVIIHQQATFRLSPVRLIIKSTASCLAELLIILFQVGLRNLKSTDSKLASPWLTKHG